MTRDIHIKDNGEFTQYVPTPLVGGDIQAYRLVFATSENLENAVFKITAQRADGGTVTDMGTTKGKTGYYTLKNNMYSEPGEVRIRLAIVGGDGSILTSKEAVFTAIEGSNDGVGGENSTPILSEILSTLAREKEHTAQLEADTAQLGQDLTDHGQDMSLHISEEERSDWGGIRSDVEEMLGQEQEHRQEGDMQLAGQIASNKIKIERLEENLVITDAHVDNEDIHLTQQFKDEAWGTRSFAEQVNIDLNAHVEDDGIHVTPELRGLINGLATVKKYGARRAIGAALPVLERMWDAVGLTANVGVDSQAVINDFDKIYPWSHMRRCNIQTVNGKITVMAYEGEPTYKADGSNGNVAVEIPEFYSCPPYFYDDGYEYWGVSEFAIGGWIKHEKSYSGAYNASLSADGTKLQSISGAFPEVTRSRTSFRTLAGATDECCHLIDLRYHDALSTLFTVEFATLDSQSKMSGATSLPYAAVHRPIIEETGVNRVVLPNFSANAYVIGCTLDIGTSQGGRQVAKDRIVTAIGVYDAENKAIMFDGDPVTTAVTQFVYAAGWKSGICDGVAASSGSIISNTNGKYPCKYRGIENPWGNVWQWIDGVNINNWQAWVCENPNEYADGKFTEPYRKLSYINGSVLGYSKKMGLDVNYPWARFPVETGGSSGTHYADYYYGATGVQPLSIGGHFYSNTNAGLWQFGASSGAAQEAVSIGTRLSWSQ